MCSTSPVWYIIEWNIVKSPKAVKSNQPLKLSGGQNKNFFSIFPYFPIGFPHFFIKFSSCSSQWRHREGGPGRGRGGGKAPSRRLCKCCNPLAWFVYISQVGDLLIHREFSEIWMWQSNHSNKVVIQIQGLFKYLFSFPGICLLML